MEQTTLWENTKLRVNYLIKNDGRVNSPEIAVCIALVEECERLHKRIDRLDNVHRSFA